jgi:alkylation response protein AidB-like acyl-CoA dehydrogenase
MDRSESGDKADDGRNGAQPANPFRIDTDEERGFREDVRSWIADSLPDDLRGQVLRPDHARLQVWQRLLYERGWIAPHWPREAGGMGASVREQLILVEEMVRAGAPQLLTPGLGFVGPLLFEYGTEAQKDQHLGPILRSETEWAQGYSEPGAGSDLASLRTMARRTDDGFVVDGHKIWQTWGHYADWMFTLVRTDTEARKYDGISCLLVDLRSPGITVRPIITITGEDELSEVFFDSVKVPAENLVGDLNGGWRLANALLTHERLGGSNPQFCMAALERTRRIAAETGAMDDPAFRDRLAVLEIKTLSLAALFENINELREAGGLKGPETSVLKIVATQTLQAISDLMTEASGGHAADALDQDAGIASTAAANYLQSRRATIFGGTLEIHKGIVAKRVLDLP